MTAQPTEWVLDELGPVVEAQPAAHPLLRVDGDESQQYEGGGAFDTSGAVRDHAAELQDANVVTASYVERSDEYVGTGPDLSLEEVVELRVEGLHHSEFGHVDPAGQDGVPFHGTDDALVQQIVDRLYANLRFPDAGRTPVGFTHLSIQHFPDVGAFADFYDYRLEVRFDGFETLP